MNDEQKTANRSTFRRLGVVVVAMFGFGYLMVPFYEKFCEVTGIRNIGRADDIANTQVDTGRTVRVELDGNLRNTFFEVEGAAQVVRVVTGESE